MDDAEPAPRRRWVRPLALGVATLLVAGGGFAAWAIDRGGEERFCTLGLGFTEIDGETVYHQDGGDPGPDGCDGDDTSKTGLILGLDCKIRNPEGTVVGTSTPSGPEPTCP